MTILKCSATKCLYNEMSSVPEAILRLQEIMLIVQMKQTVEVFVTARLPV
mgnify:CR=1 FL=1